MANNFNVFTTCFQRDEDQLFEGATSYSTFVGFSVVNDKGDEVIRIVDKHNGTFIVQNSYYEDLYSITAEGINKLKAFKLEALN